VVSGYFFSSIALPPDYPRISIARCTFIKEPAAPLVFCFLKAPQGPGGENGRLPTSARCGARLNPLGRRRF